MTDFWRLVRKEATHRKLTFALSLLAIVIAASVLVSELTVLKAHDLQTDFILEEKEQRLEGEMAKMEDDYRKIALELGLNVLILPEGENPDDFYAEGYTSKFMPEEYIERVAESNLVTINHLLPILEQKIRWTEQGNQTIMLVGTRGETPVSWKPPEKQNPMPTTVGVAPGKIVLGYELWDSLNVGVGDTVELLGENFEVEKCHSRRGTIDDITAWIDLGQAQHLLGMEGSISGIRLLQCLCEGYDPPTLKRDIEEILPGTQAILLENRALTRWEARSNAKAVAKSSLARELAHRSKLRGEIESFVALLIPLVSIVSMALIGVLTLNNVRERRQEIAILRTLGYRSRQILNLFLAKALLLGVIGATLGYLIGFSVAIAPGTGPGSGTIATLFDVRILAMVLVAAPGMSLLASWVPALIAAREDPADILRAG
ncbi:MAG: FtsX-like permease family protein [Euryarchaeota archaeon]|nr:FtsX-like permease family protein [Euryarchaeota archaeon]